MLWIYFVFSSVESNWLLQGIVSKFCVWNLFSLYIFLSLSFVKIEYIYFGSYFSPIVVPEKSHWDEKTNWPVNK